MSTFFGLYSEHSVIFHLFVFKVVYLNVFLPCTAISFPGFTLSVGVGGGGDRERNCYRTFLYFMYTTDNVLNKYNGHSDDE